ncbi:hypothetical protein RF11_00517 [Thelohanellus kitauei]|uniref:Uncharacterized protein n=1 Tax=Thelohanellus kitauei TaxID=669202 RepID=A0A0C2N744_THEKT|nr:hypothetical protein RF11_00517 [Thelohanellus kitauei]
MAGLDHLERLCISKYPENEKTMKFLSLLFENIKTLEKSRGNCLSLGARNSLYSIIKKIILKSCHHNKDKQNYEALAEIFWQTKDSISKTGYLIAEKFLNALPKTIYCITNKEAFYSWLNGEIKSILVESLERVPLFCQSIPSNSSWLIILHVSRYQKNQMNLLAEQEKKISEETQIRASQLVSILEGCTELIDKILYTQTPQLIFECLKNETSWAHDFLETLRLKAKTILRELESDIYKEKNIEILHNQQL